MTAPGHESWAALLTPAGTGAMAVIRLAGRDAPSLLQRCFVPRHAADIATLPPDRLAYGQVVDGDEIVDDGIVALRPHPSAGYIADMTIHGGTRVIERVLLLLQRLGAGIELQADRSVDGSSETALESEITLALAHAKTTRAVRFLARQRPALHAELDAIVEICDADEEAGRARLEALLIRSRSARLLVEGATLVVVGPVNAGKSTLLNRLFPASRSLVSDQPGTTRDWVGVEAAIQGIPIEAIDTAGLRIGADDLEREAITRGLRRIREADVQLVVVDGSATFPSEFLDGCRGVIDPRRAVAVMNKSDLPSAWPQVGLDDHCAASVRTCGLDGDGMAALTEAILAVLDVAPEKISEPALFTGRLVSRLRRLLDDVPAGRLAQAVRTEFAGDSQSPKCRD